ncbi:hypothetical protein J6590_038782 [Homalodisca vitripennis]|nr:hypothetical protein J6590_038782 [Homalodisca vitripennis]
MVALFNSVYSNVRRTEFTFPPVPKSEIYLHTTQTRPIDFTYTATPAAAPAPALAPTLYLSPTITYSPTLK